MKPFQYVALSCYDKRNLVPVGFNVFNEDYSVLKLAEKKNALDDFSERNI